MKLELDLTEALEVRLPDAQLRTLAEQVAELIAEREPGGYLDVTAAAEFLACSKDRIYTLVSVGRIPHHKDGSRTLFKRSELEAYVRNGGAKCP
jgi:excisionase family DNA binding protein